MKQKKYFYKITNKRTFKIISERSSDSLDYINKNFKKDVFLPSGMMKPEIYYECRIEKNF